MKNISMFFIVFSSFVCRVNAGTLLTVTKKYFSITNMKGSVGDTQPWCAAFAYWCLVSVGYQHTGNYTAYARSWSVNESKVWYGYFVGINENGNPILLEDNQSDKLCLSTFKKDNIYSYVKLKGYIIFDTLEQLP